eukprot:jgi/Mesvir1/20882/Mv07960-RA.1
MSGSSEAAINSKAWLNEKRKRLEELRNAKNERQRQQGNKDVGAGDDVDQLVSSLLSADPKAAYHSLHHTAASNSYPSILASNLVPGPSALGSSTRSSLLPSQDGAVTKGMAAPVAGLSGLAKSPPARRHLVIAETVASIDIPPRPAETYEKVCQTDISPGREEPATHREPVSPERDARMEDAAAMDDDSTEPGGGSKPPGTPRPSSVDPDAVVALPSFASFLSRSALIMERVLSTHRDYDFLQDYSAAGSGADASGAGQGGSAEGGSSDENARRLPLLCSLRDPRAEYHGAGVSGVAPNPKFPELVAASYASPLRWRSGAALAGIVDASDGVSGPGAAGVANGGLGGPGVGQPDGLVLLWSLQLRERAEMAFHCSSTVTSVSFDPFSPKLLLGGCYSGQLVMWDVRVGPVPVQRTARGGSHAGGGHQHPVYSLAVVGSAHAHNVVSASTDGRVCVWSPSMLSEPQEVLQLRYAPPSAAAGSGPGGISDHRLNIASLALQARDVPVTALAFPPHEENAFFVGGEDGGLYSVVRHGSDALRSGIRESFLGMAAGGHSTAGGLLGPSGTLVPGASAGAAAGLAGGDKVGIGGGAPSKAHAGAVTGMSCHPGWPDAAISANVGVDVADARRSTGLLLTSSTDWTCKLWNTRAPAAGPMLTFDESGDYCHAAVWSPIHPALFALSSGAGDLQLWHLNRSLERPWASVASPSKRALNQLAWLQDGRRVVGGDSGGQLHVFEPPADVSQPLQDEWERFERTLGELHQRAVASKGVPGLL